MSKICPLCSTLLYSNGFCPNCDQDQLEKPRSTTIDFSKDVTRRPENQPSTGSQGADMSGSGTSQVKQTVVSRDRPSTHFSTVGETTENSDDHEPDF